MRRILATAVLAITMVAQGSVSWAEDRAYKCSDGTTFTLKISADKATADLILSGQAAEKLTREAGPADMYTGPTASFFADGDTASLAYMKGSEQMGTDCKKQ